VLAGVIVVIPLYCVAMLMSFVAARFGTTFIYGQSEGVYDHYFNTFLIPVDLIWSFFQAFSMSAVIMLVHTYYGYTASGGPAGVGEGRRPGSAHIAGGVGGGHPVRLPRHLRAHRQLPHVRITPWTENQDCKRIHPLWWTARTRRHGRRADHPEHPRFSGKLSRPFLSC